MTSTSRRMRWRGSTSCCGASRTFPWSSFTASSIVRTRPTRSAATVSSPRTGIRSPRIARWPARAATPVRTSAQDPKPERRGRRIEVSLSILGPNLEAVLAAVELVFRRRGAGGEGGRIDLAFEDRVLLRGAETELRPGTPDPLSRVLVDERVGWRRVRRQLEGELNLLAIRRDDV